MFLVNGLILSSGIVLLHPEMIPIGIDGFTGDIDTSMFHGIEGTITAESYLKKQAVERNLTNVSNHNINNNNTFTSAYI